MAARFTLMTTSPKDLLAVVQRAFSLFVHGRALPVSI
jgi:hypothetical protein